MIPASLRRTPSSMRRIMRELEQELARLFEEARPELENIVDSRALAEPEELDPQAGERIGRVIELRILEPGRRLVEAAQAKAYRAGVARSAQLLKRIGIDAALGTIPTDRLVLAALDQRSLAALKGITDEMSKTIMQELTDGAIRGENPNDIARRISAAVDEVGIVRARTMARTETMYAIGQAEEQRYRQHGIAQVEWLATPDPGRRTCDDCAALDGKKYPLDDHPKRPLHPNCRCDLLPVVEDP